MCPTSFALGRWRGEHGRRAVVRLAPTICPASYAEGFAEGDRQREARRTARGPRR